MQNEKQQIIAAGKLIMEKQLTWATSGNISVRTGDQVFVTASGTVLGALKEEDILVCSLDGTYPEGGKKPSKELGMHLAVYRKRPDVGGIVHTSPFYGTLCACSDLELKKNLFIESMFYDRELLRIPYFHAGSKELAQAVADAADQTNVILMGNHGLLVYGTSLKEAMKGIEITENTCKMNVMAAMGGFRLQEVPPATVKDFLEGGYYK